MNSAFAITLQSVKVQISLKNGSTNWIQGYPSLKYLLHVILHAHRIDYGVLSTTQVYSNFNSATQGLSEHELESQIFPHIHLSIGISDYTVDFSW